MTTTPDDGTTAPDSTGSYDPAADPDSDPEMLNPRTGDAARSGTGDDADQDPDSDPDELNPRG